MAFKPNLRLSSAVLGGLARPDFSRSAGLAIGAGMLGAQRRQDEAETRATQEAGIELLRKAQVAQETGDMGMLGNINDELDALLSSTRNEQARQAIMKTIETVQGQRGATQSQAQTNTAMSIIKTEQALEQLQQQDARRASGELVEVAPFEERQRKALEERLAQMKQNGAAVAEADTIKYTTQLTQLTREEKIREQQSKAVTAALASTPKDSKQYEGIVARANKMGLGGAVKKFEKSMLEAEKLDIEVQKLKDENPAKPLTPDQKRRLQSTGYNLTGDPVIDRKEFVRLAEGEAKAARAIALRDITEVSGGEAKAVVRQALRDIQNEPGADLSGNLFDDLSEEIDELSDEELQEIYDLSEGKTPLEIRQIAVDWTKSKFSDEFEDMLKVQESEARELDEAASAIDAVLAATNAKSGAKPGDENYKDPNDPLVRSAALERLKSDASKQRALTQAQGVGGRVL